MMGTVAQLEHYEKIEGEALELDGKANRLSNLIRQNLPAAMQGLVVVPLYAGYDLRRNVGRLWKFDITGGRYEETEFEATGSGGLYARESLKNHWDAEMSRDAAILPKNGPRGTETAAKSGSCPRMCANPSPWK